MYGSSLRLVTRTPREVRIAASDAAPMPFPSEETKPPVTNTNLVIGWPVPEIGILPERSRAQQRDAARRANNRRLFAGYNADARCARPCSILARVAVRPSNSSTASIDGV